MVWGLPLTHTAHYKIASFFKTLRGFFFAMFLLLLWFSSENLIDGNTMSCQMAGCLCVELKVSTHQGQGEAGFPSQFKLFLYVLALYLPSMETAIYSAAVPKGLELLHLELLLHLHFLYHLKSYLSYL